MDPALRSAYNAAFTPALYDHYLARIRQALGPFPFRIAETPLFVPDGLRDFLQRASEEILAQLSDPALLRRMEAAIPARYRAPGQDPLPNCAQLDFAVVRGADGELQGRIVELQGFPSVYGLTLFHGRILLEALARLPGLSGARSFLFAGLDEEGAVAALRRTILDGEDPEQVVMLDLDPVNQKTYVDFVATRRLIGIDHACPTELVRQGDRLFRRKDGRLVPIRRIYNRVVFDELERRGMALPFSFTEPLDLSWCPHPNWYWLWSKYSLLHLAHPAVPRTCRASGPAAVEALRAAPRRFVLKPLFSFAGSGVKVDATEEDLAAIPEAERDGYILQHQIDYARELLTPDGEGVAAEVRVMCLRAPGEAHLRPVWNLVRLSRGRMMGVDHNRAVSWVGSSVGLWRPFGGSGGGASR